MAFAEVSPAAIISIMSTGLATILAPVGKCLGGWARGVTQGQAQVSAPDTPHRPSLSVRTLGDTTGLFLSLLPCLPPSCPHPVVHDDPGLLSVPQSSSPFWA